MTYEDINQETNARAETENEGSRRQFLVDHSSSGGEMFPSAGLLEACRTKWQYGNWTELATLSEESLQADPDRSKVAILVAAAQSQCGDMQQARRFARKALEWGCGREIAARVLVSGAINSIACAADALGEEQAAREHFEEAISLVEPQADVCLLAQTRRIHELARAGSLPQAADVLEVELDAIYAEPERADQRLNILSGGIELLKHELMIALQRDQLYGGEDMPAEGYEQKAVSQLGQELWVLERTGYKRGGFFVEFGATDGVTLSNSWLLEKEFGWNGLCAEPNPDFFRKLQENRSCQVSDACISGRTGEQVEFILADVYGGIADYADADMHHDKRAAYSAEGEVLKLTTVSLEDFLTQRKAPRCIDYLSIDTEGSEYEILRHFPFNKWEIRLITVEHNFTPQREMIRRVLEGHGYRLSAEKDFDDWYELERGGAFASSLPL